MFMKAVVALCAFASAVVASPNLVQRQTPVPYPHSDAVWVIGFRHNVTWDPSAVTGTDGTIFLAKGGVIDPSPLTSGFDLSNGRTEITVPSVEPSTDYTVVLTINGTSAASEQFTIATSKSSLPSSAAPASTGQVTTVAFPSTTIVTTLSTLSDLSAASSIASSAASAASSASASASSASASASSAVASISSALSSASASASSALSSVTAPASSGASGSAASGSSSGNAGMKVELMSGTAAKFVVATVVVAVSAGAWIL